MTGTELIIRLNGVGLHCEVARARWRAMLDFCDRSGGHIYHRTAEFPDRRQHFVLHALNLLRRTGAWILGPTHRENLIRLTHDDTPLSAVLPPHLTAVMEEKGYQEATEALDADSDAAEDVADEEATDDAADAEEASEEASDDADEEEAK